MKKNTVSTTITAENAVKEIKRAQEIANEIMCRSIIMNSVPFNNIKVASVPINLLFVDTNGYQRPAQNKVREIAKEWSDDNCGFLLVSYREKENRFAIVDGGNRYEAAKLVGKKELPCQILTGLSIKKEAAVFSAQNKNRTQIKQRDLLKALVCAKDKNAMKLQEICDEFGIRTDVGYGMSVLKAVYDCRVIMDNDPSGETLKWIFNIIKESGWHSLNGAYGKDLITGLNKIRNARLHCLTETEKELISLFRHTTPNLLAIASVSDDPTTDRYTAIYKYLLKYLETEQESTSESEQEFDTEKVIHLTAVN